MLLSLILHDVVHRMAVREKHIFVVIATFVVVVVVVVLLFLLMLSRPSRRISRQDVDSRFFNFHLNLTWMWHDVFLQLKAATAASYDIDFRLGLLLGSTDWLEEISPNSAAQLFRKNNSLLSHLCTLLLSKEIFYLNYYIHVYISR